MPTHAVEGPDGDIFVSDGYGQNRIHRFSASGEHKLTFGGGRLGLHPQAVRHRPDRPARSATDPGQFNVPHDLLIVDDSRLYVMDRENGRWQVFTPGG